MSYERQQYVKKRFLVWVHKNALCAMELASFSCSQLQLIGRCEIVGMGSDARSDRGLFSLPDAIRRHCDTLLHAQLHQ